MTGGHIHNLKGRRYTPDRPVKILDRRVTQFSDIYWKVEVEGVVDGVVKGVVYHVARTQGKMVRIAFKPRGQNIGHHWLGAVRDEKGKDVWTARVTKSTGPLAMLHDAGIIRWAFEVAPDSWTCFECNLGNHAQDRRCKHCGTPRPTVEEQEAAEEILKRAEVEQRITDILDGI